MSATTTPTPTERQASLIQLASRKRGATRADVRDVLEYGEGAPIPVQAILKQIAERFGFEMTTTYGDGTNTRAATYHFAKKMAAKRAAKRAAKKSTRKAS